MKSLFNRLRKIEQQSEPPACLVVYAADAGDDVTPRYTPEQIEAWKMAHPGGTVIMVEYQESLIDEP